MMGIILASFFFVRNNYPEPHQDACLYNTQTRGDGSPCLSNRLWNWWRRFRTGEQPCTEKLEGVHRDAQP